MKLASARTLLISAALSAGGCSLIADLSAHHVGEGGIANPNSDAGADVAAVDAAGDTAGDASSTYRSEVLSDDPRAYFRLGEAAGASVARDEIGQISGVYKNVKLGVPGALKDGNTAADFDGATSGISLGDVFDFEGTAPYSIEVWLQPRKIDTAYRCIAGKEEPSGNQKGQVFWLETSGLTLERFGFDGGKDKIVAPIPKLNVWTHVVFTYDGTAMRLFMDGDEVLPSVPTTRPLPNVGAAFVFGAAIAVTSIETFDGALDELAIYDKALTAARVRAHFIAAN